MNHDLRLVLAFCCFWSLPIAAQESQIPNPFTLDDVMSWSPNAHPEFLRQQAIGQGLLATQSAIKAEKGLNLSLRGRLGQREFSDERQDFNQVFFNVSTPLFDFGRSEGLLAAVATESEANQHLLAYQTQAYQLRLMRALFEVMLADLDYRVKNEAMAIAFVTLDKVEEDYALERVSEVKLRQYQREYQQTFVKRQRAQMMMRQTRLQLGNALGLGAVVVPRVDVPNEITLPAELKPLAFYQQRLIEMNPLLQALQQQERADLQRVDAARAEFKPLVSANVKVGQLSSYPRVREGRWEAGINLEIPLYDNGLNESKVARAQAKVSMSQADYEAQAQALRDQLTQLYFELTLLEVESQALDARQVFAHVNLDFARAMYENELQTDFGHAMVDISQADYDLLAFNFRKILLWAQLNSLLGAKELLNFDRLVKESGND